ncbi:unnamed protein product [Colias eurytheme]|nr:unnamed protein product [Colias eurytheme]
MADDPLNIKNFVTEKLSESMQNVDVMSLLQNLAASDNAKGEIKDRLTSVMTQLSSMSAEEKEVFMAYVKKLLTKKLETHFRNNPPDLSNLEEALTGAVKEQLIYAAVIIFVVIVLVGMVLLYVLWCLFLV